MKNIIRKHPIGVALITILIGLAVFGGIMQARALDVPFAAMYDSSSLEQNQEESSLIDRYIVKYKDSGHNRNLQGVPGLYVVEAYSIASKANISADIRGSERLECMVLREKVDPADLADLLKAAGMAAEIEFIQPDFVLSLAGVELTSEDDLLAQEIEGDIEDRPLAEDTGITNQEGVDEGFLYLSGGELAEKALPEEIVQEEKITVPLLYADREDIVVAIIDTAVDTNHPALRRLFTDGWNFIDSTADVHNCGQPLTSIHSTFISGIIAAMSAGQVRIMPLQVFAEHGANAHGAYTSDIIAAILYAEAQGARIVNCSFVGNQANRALYETMADSSMLFVASAGNANASLDTTPVFPAAFTLDNVISVASQNPDKGLSRYSNYSGALVDIAARGRDVKSSLPGGGYGVYSGTSMAAGYVSAAAGWVLYENPGLSATELKERLCQTGDKLAYLQDKVKDGRSLNYRQALAGEEQTTIIFISPEEDLDEQGYAASPEDYWALYATPTMLYEQVSKTITNEASAHHKSQHIASSSRGGSSKTVHGYVWPMASDIWGLGSWFLNQHDITVELRETFAKPAEPELCTLVTNCAYSALGEFTIEDAPLGTYVLYIKRPGYLARAMMLTVSGNDPDIIELEPPGVLDNGIFNLWYGDCNGDYRVDNSDIMLILELMDLGVNALDPLYNAACDLNGDALIDNQDIMMVLEYWDCFVGDYAGAEDIDFFDDGTTFPTQVIINAEIGKQYDITVAADNISSFNGMEIKVCYDTAVFDIVDLCAYTKTKEITVGAIVAAGITISQVSAGEIRLSVDKVIPPGTQWAGALTTIRLKAKMTTESVVSVE